MLTMPAAYAAKAALLHELQHPRLLCMSLDEVPSPEWVHADFFFHPLHRVEGLEVAQLLAPPGQSALLVRGAMGAHHQRVRLPQQVQLHVLHGALLWWQASHGPDPRRLDVGHRLTLAPNEEHGFVVLEDALIYNLITPNL
jgi:hypothetical protein